MSHIISPAVFGAVAEPEAGPFSAERTLAPIPGLPAYRRLAVLALTWFLLLITATGMASANCPSAGEAVKNSIERLAQANTLAEKQAAIEDLKNLAVLIHEKKTDLKVHNEVVSELLYGFAEYLEQPDSGPTSFETVNASYKAALKAILKSPTAPTGTRRGQKAVRTINQIGRLYASVEDDVLATAIASDAWADTGGYVEPADAFTSNALRTQLDSAFYRDMFGNSHPTANAAAVVWRGPGDVVFSGFYQNLPEFPGTSALPEPTPDGFWQKQGARSPRYRITDGAEYATWVGDHAYAREPGEYPLSDAIRQRIRNRAPGVYNNQTDGLPGTHAEVQAANDLAFRLNLNGADTLMPIISVHTVRTTQSPPCSGFECCTGCTNVLRGWAVSTGGGGTFGDPYR